MSKVRYENDPGIDSDMEFTDEGYLRELEYRECKESHLELTEDEEFWDCVG